MKHLKNMSSTRIYPSIRFLFYSHFHSIRNPYQNHFDHKAYLEWAYVYMIRIERFFIFAFVANSCRHQFIIPCHLQLFKHSFFVIHNYSLASFIIIIHLQTSAVVHAFIHYHLPSISIIQYHSSSSFIIIFQNLSAFFITYHHSQAFTTFSYYSLSSFLVVHHNSSSSIFIFHHSSSFIIIHCHLPIFSIIISYNFPSFIVIHHHSL